MIGQDYIYIYIFKSELHRGEGHFSWVPVHLHFNKITIKLFRTTNQHHKPQKSPTVRAQAKPEKSNRQPTKHSGHPQAQPTHEMHRLNHDKPTYRNDLTKIRSDWARLEKRSSTGVASPKPYQPKSAKITQIEINFLHPLPSARNNCSRRFPTQSIPLLL